MLINTPQTDHTICAAPLKAFEDLEFTPPHWSCDTHAHVIGHDPQIYPLVDERSYTPPPASETDYLSMLSATGMERGVLIQVSVHGTDNTLLLETLRNNPCKLRGIAVVDPSVSKAHLLNMHNLGIRGVRLNVLFGGGVGFGAMKTLAKKISPLGWHLQVLMDVRELPHLYDRIVELPVPVVIDHMGHMPSTLGTDNPGFQSLLDLVKNHNVWAKLSGAYRIDSSAHNYPHARNFASKLIQTAPSRLIYGSDWPHVGLKKSAMPDTVRLCNLFHDWVGDKELLYNILVDNPNRLYFYE